MLTPGAVLGERYRLIRRIGEGGMGTVFEAEHTLVGIRVAIKVMLPECARHADVVERFEREARAAGAIGHPGIVGVVDFGRHEEQPYMVMEYLEGEDLADRLDREGPLPIGEAVWVLSEVLSALSAAHAAGIVHRDLKPENVFVVRKPDGTSGIKVLDFGVSKFGAEEALGGRSLTKTGVLMGTPTYMAPEQALARRDVDLRADIYAAGVLLYEILTNKLPYEAESQAELLMAIVYQKPPATPVRTHRPEVSEALAAVIARAMNPDRELRFQNAAAMIVALKTLDAIAESEVTVACSRSEVTPVPPSPSRVLTTPRALRWMSLAVFSLVALSALGFGLRPSAPRMQRPVTREVRVDLQNVPPGATVALDGVVTALRAFNFVRHSAHELEVSAPGSATFQSSFIAERDRSVVIALAAIDPPVLPRLAPTPQHPQRALASLQSTLGPHAARGPRGHHRRRQAEPTGTPPPDPRTVPGAQTPLVGSTPRGVLTPTNVF